jgi:hypothetical protein
MSTTDEHTPTKQETQIYTALTAGDHDTITELQEAAYTADQAPPASKPGDGGGAPEGWLPPAEQFDVDYTYAHAHYQDDHEMPEDEREANTADAVTEHNDYAARAAAAE